MPVIRSGSEPEFPPRPPNPSPEPAATAPKATVTPIPPSSVSRVPTSDMQALASGLREVQEAVRQIAHNQRAQQEGLRATEGLKESVEHAAQQAHTGMLRGLQALDDRMAQRQLDTASALGPILNRQTETLDSIRAELNEAIKAHRQRVDVFETRIYDTLASFISILQQLRSEVAAVADSVSSLQSQLRLEAGMRLRD